MKPLKSFLLFFLLSLMLSSCGCQNVNAGYVGVKVYLLGSKKGVDREVLPVGQYFIGINEQLYTYPTFIQRYSFTLGTKDGDSPEDEAFYFQNKDGVKCNIDVGIQCHAEPDKISVLFQTYREELRDVIHKNVRLFIQEGVQKYLTLLSTEELYSDKKNIAIKSIESDLIERLAPIGIKIISLSSLSNVRFPEEVDKAIVAKIQATQEAMQRENEVQKARADAEIKITAAKAEAESIRMRQQVITPNLIQYEAVQKWNGVLPSYMMGNGVPFINIK